jgi:hypothetical protein
MGLLEFSSNIADAEAPPQLPAGEYKCVCTAAVDKKAASSGNPMLTLTLQIPSSEFPADFDGGEGVDALTFTSNIVSRDIPADRWRMKNTCKAFGVPMSSSIDPNDFVGREARARVRMGTDLEKNPRAEVGSVLPL